MSEVTQLLHAASSGDRKAAEDLLPLVYEELRRLATARMAQESAGHTLQPTALVHEAWIRLVSSNDQGWEGKGHFFGAASEAMRRILVDHARKKLAQKRGEGAERVDLAGIELAAEANDTTLLRVDECLEKLAGEDAQAAAVVKLRFFTGLTNEETALALGISERTSKRAWAFARAWIFDELQTGQA